MKPKDFINNKKDNLQATFDHIKPKSFGGTNSWRNIRLTHFKCNKMRGNTYISERDRPTNCPSLIIKYANNDFAEL